MSEDVGNLLGNSVLFFTVYTNNASGHGLQFTDFKYCYY